MGGVLSSSLTLVDSAGVAHYVTLHMVSTLPPSVQRLPVEPKWPCKARFRQQRDLERLQKIEERLRETGDEECWY